MLVVPNKTVNQIKENQIIPDQIKKALERLVVQVAQALNRIQDLMYQDPSQDLNKRVGL